MSAVIAVISTEDQSTGQRIRSFSVDGRNASTTGSGGWTSLLLNGQSIGHKRIIKLSPPLKLTAIRLRVHKAIGEAAIRSIAAFAVDGCSLPPAPPAPPCELQHNFEYTGNYLGTPTTQSSVTACCAACRKIVSHKCVGFAYTIASKVCALFGSTGGARKTAGVTSGAPIWSD